jgi:glycosyl transferase family 87
VSAISGGEQLRSEPGPAFRVGLLSACGLLVAVYAIVLAMRLGQIDALWDAWVFWTAGRLALAGNAAAVYDWSSLSAALAAFGTTPRLDPFFYPPIFLLLLAPLALLPFGAATAAWLGLNVAAYLSAIRAILPGRTTLLVALAAPVVLFNLNKCQNGLLTAGLLGGALTLIDTRPVASGVLIGLLAYKPQFGVLLPFFLAVTGRWRVFVSATATVLLLVGSAAALFGLDTLVAFASLTPVAADDLVRHVQTAGVTNWENVQSAYGMLRAFGAGAGLAWSVHILAAVAAAAIALALARNRAPNALSVAALSTAAVVVSPYSQLYDLAILMVPWALLVGDRARSDSRRWEGAVLLIVYLLPLLSLLGHLSKIPLLLPGLTSWAGVGPLMCLLLLAVIGSQAMRRSVAAPALVASRRRGPPVPGSNG